MLIMLKERGYQSSTKGRGGGGGEPTSAFQSLSHEDEDYACNEKRSFAESHTITKTMKKK